MRGAKGGPGWHACSLLCPAHLHLYSTPYPPGLPQHSDHVKAALLDGPMLMDDEDVKIFATCGLPAASTMSFVFAGSGQITEEMVESK
jgi:hypothetical protein